MISSMPPGFSAANARLVEHRRVERAHELVGIVVIILRGEDEIGRLRRTDLGRRLDRPADIGELGRGRELAIVPPRHRALPSHRAWARCRRHGPRARPPGRTAGSSIRRPGSGRSPPRPWAGRKRRGSPGHAGARPARHPARGPDRPPRRRHRRVWQDRTVRSLPSTLAASSNTIVDRAIIRSSPFWSRLPDQPGLRNL